MRISKQRTLSGDLIVWLTTTIILLVAVMSTAYFTYSSILEERELKKKATKLTNEIAKVSALPLWDFDTNLIKQIAHAYLSSDFIVGIKLMADKDIVYESFPEDLDNTFIRRKEAILPASSVKGKHEQIASGMVEVLFTRDSIKQTQLSMIYTILILLVFIIIIIIIGTSFIMRFILNKPLDQLIKGIQIIAHGEYRHPLEMVAQSDLNNIIKEVNTMAKHISKREKEMQLLNIALAESENKYRSIFENAVEGIFQTNPDGRFLNANMSMAKIMGYSSPEELIASVTNVANDCFANFQDIDKIEKALKKTGMVINAEIKLRRKDGTVFWANQSVRVVYDSKGQAIYNEGSLIDISARKEKDKAERERKWAEAKTKAKSDFLANMSHEIRTPMNAVIGFTDLALKTDLTPKQNDYLTKIKASSLSLLTIINDILDFSKIEAGKLEIETTEFNLESVFENVADIISIKAEEKGLELLIDIANDVPVYLIGDPLRLGQILINLAGNAVKFTEKGEVVLRAEIEKAMIDDDPRKTSVRFSVQDTGIGLSPSQIKKLFTAFSQADRFTTRKYGGTGLGLAISKHLCKMMGGWISVTSTEGIGSKFEFTAVFRRQPKEKQYILPADLCSRHILLVEDNPSAGRIITRLLTFFDFNVTPASSGKEALRKLEAFADERDFKLIVIDWKMPEQDGIETVRNIKATKGFKRIPILLMLSVYKQEELIKDAQNAGVDFFLTKPVNPNKLFNALMNAFGKSKSGAIIESDENDITYENLELIRGSHILITEDIEVNRQVAVELLKGEGFRTSVAHNGLEAVEMVCHSDLGADLDAILMDIQMPELDGYEATQRIRSDVRFKDLPIIAMTAHALVGEKEKCIKAGMNDHSTKPIEPEKLFAILAKWIPPKRKANDGANRQNISDGDIKSEKNAKDDNQSRPTETVPQPGASNAFDIPILPPVLPGISIKDGLRRVGGNKKVYHKLLMIFFKAYSAEQGKVKATIDNDDFQKAQTLIHAIKGASGNIGAEALFESTKELEQSLKSLDKQRIQPLFETFCRHLEQVLASIARIQPPDTTVD